jgi:hypothetical protein
VLEPVQCVHAFTSTASTFFIPTTSAGLRLFAGKKLLSQRPHVLTVLYFLETCLVEFELVARVIYYFVYGKTTRAHCANGAGFNANPG